MSRYTGVTERDLRQMLDAIGVDSVDDLFAEIPEGVRLGRELDLPAGRAEQDVFEHLAGLAARNRHSDEETTFLGAGMYDHYVPSLVDTLLQRSEFLTPYTPYQPEVSQGGLQVMFEFQTAISELTGLPVSNASVYEEPSAVAAPRASPPFLQRRRRCGLPGEARDEALPPGRLARPAPALSRRPAHPRGRLWNERGGGPADAGGGHRPRRIGGGR